MFWFALLLALTCTLAMVLAVIGRIVASAFRIDALNGDEPEHWLAALIFGTGMVTLLSGWCSYAGLGAREHRWIVLAALVALFAVTAIRGDARRLLRVNAPYFGILIAIILATRAALYLLPVLGKGSHGLTCDALIYVPAADFLSQHGFALAGPEVRQPMDQLIASLHSLSHRMGPIFLHGLVTSVTPHLGAFELFPVMIALGTMHTLAATFLIARWCFDVKRVHAAAGLAFMAVLVHSLALSSTGGFLCQLYGMAVLSLALAVMPRLMEPGSWTMGNALLAGSLIALQMTMYSELAPVLIVVSLVGIALAVANAARTSALRRFGWFFCGCVCCAAALANIEIIRCWRGVQVMLAMNGVGCHIDWSPWQYAEFTLGCDAIDFVFNRPLGGWRFVLSAATTCLFFAIGLAAWTTRKAVFPLTALAVLAALFAFYSLCRSDPWTHERGQTWNLLKICKWAFPIVAATQIAGLGRLIAVLESRRLALGALIAVVFTVAQSHWDVHREESRAIAMTNHQKAGQDSPYSAAGKLRSRLAALDGPIHLVRIPEPSQDGPLAASLFYPHRMVNSWENDPHYSNPALRCDWPDAFGPKTTFLFFGSPPFQKTPETFPFGFARLDPVCPTLVRIDYFNRHFVPAHDKVVAIDDMTLTCWIFATREGEAELSLETADAAELSSGRLTILAERNEAWVSVVGGRAIRLSFQLKRGMNRVDLKWSGEPFNASEIAARWKNSGTTP